MQSLARGITVVLPDSQKIMLAGFREQGGSPSKLFLRYGAGLLAPPWEVSLGRGSAGNNKNLTFVTIRTREMRPISRILPCGASASALTKLDGPLS